VLLPGLVSEATNPRAALGAAAVAERAPPVNRKELCMRLRITGELCVGTLPRRVMVTRLIVAAEPRKETALEPYASAGQRLS